jgi:hypothetical protein
VLDSPDVATAEEMDAFLRKADDQLAKAANAARAAGMPEDVVTPILVVNYAAAVATLVRDADAFAGRAHVFYRPLGGAAAEAEDAGPTPLAPAAAATAEEALAAKLDPDADARGLPPRLRPGRLRRTPRGVPRVAGGRPGPRRRGGRPCPLSR